MLLITTHSCICPFDHLTGEPGVKLQLPSYTYGLTCICICKLCFESVNCGSGSSGAHVGGLQLFPGALLPLGCCSCCRLGVVEASSEAGLCCRPGLSIGTGRCLHSITFFRQQPICSNTTLHPLFLLKLAMNALSGLSMASVSSLHSLFKATSSSQRATALRVDVTMMAMSHKKTIGSLLIANCWLHLTSTSRSNMRIQNLN